MAHSIGRNPEQSGNTKICEHWLTHRIRGVTFIKHYIAGFDVTMNDALLMGVVDSHSKGCKETYKVSSGGKFSFKRSVTNIISEALPFYIVHHQISQWIP